MTSPAPTDAAVLPPLEESQKGPGPAGNPWNRLPDSAWNADTARHLLRRASWTARPDDVDRAVKEGLQGTLDRLFPAEPKPLEKPKLISAIESDEVEFRERLRTSDEIEKRRLRKELRDRFQQSYHDLVMKWLEFAADPAQSAVEKWVLCLSDVYVVAYEKVRNTSFLFQYLETLRRHALGPAPALTKAISRAPAMIDYLDLKDSKKEAPNENFARELFELFLLGEGHYTETDVKEAARAFTGYRQRLGEFVFARGQHDFTVKHVFGKSGQFDGDGIIDLAYRQPSARTFLPKEMLRYYLSEKPVSPAALESLGDLWQASHFNLRYLLRCVFSSQLFYDPSYRSNYIKSPIQLYLGLVQDLDLDVAPLARQIIGVLRQMGQMPLNPPNVRGWVGGRSWINSTTLGARRQLVQSLFSPINENALNADEEIELIAARAAGRDRFTFTLERSHAFGGPSPRDVAERLVRTFLPVPVESVYTKTLANFVAGKAPGDAPPEKVRSALLTVLESPEYQLC